jgi:uncharacterized protein (DUF302 family)
MKQADQHAGVGIVQQAFRVFSACLFALVLSSNSSMAAAPKKAPPPMNIADTVVKLPLAKGVSMDDAVMSMKARANELNMKLVAELPLSKQIVAMGETSRRIEIFQFCDPLTAKKMVEYDLHFAAYLPCRITLVEDAKGQAWLVMMNLDLFLGDPNLTSSLKTSAIEVRDTLNAIIKAGANGEI